MGTLITQIDCGRWVWVVFWACVIVLWVVILRRPKSWWNSHAKSRLSTLMQLLFSFDQDTRVDETLMQNLACQLSCNSCSRLTRTWESMKLSCKLSLANSHATLVLVWPGHESWWNSHAKSRLSTLMQLLFSFDQDMRVDETLMQTLACQLSCNSCSRLTRTWELMKLSCKISLVNSHATLVLVWPGHESRWNSHANSRLPTLMQLLFSFDQDMRVDETLMQNLACQLSCNSCSRLTRTWESMKLSCKLSRLSTLMQLLFSFDQDMRVDETLMQTLALVNSHATLVHVLRRHESWWNAEPNPFRIPLCKTWRHFFLQSTHGGICAPVWPCLHIWPGSVWSTGQWRDDELL